MNDDQSRNDGNTDLDDPNLSSSLVADLVGQAASVLVLGGDAADLSSVLSGRGCTVTAAEADETAGGATYAAVVVGDELERTDDPVALLTAAAARLEPGGRLVLVVPNVSHGSVRLALFEGRWADDRAVRRFDRAGLLRVVDAAGLAVEELRGSLADPMDTDVRVDGARLPASLVEWVRDQPDALVRTFVLAAAPGAGSDAPTLASAVPEAEVRRQDRFTERAQADLEERHRVLTQRDHIVGLEAAAATAQYAAELVERKMRGATRRLNRKNVRIKELAKQVRKLESQLGDGGGAQEPPGWRKKLGRG